MQKSMNSSRRSKAWAKRAGRRTVLYLSIAGLGVLTFIILQGISAQNHKLDYVFTVRRIFEQSYNQVTDSLVSTWDSVFAASGLRENPFGMTVFFINLFNSFKNESPELANAYYNLKSILTNHKTNPRSSAIATVAVMQKLGWDIQLFYNQQECYLGLNFKNSWTIRKGNWIVKNDKKYYLKEFDNSTPAGGILNEHPTSVYQSIEPKRQDLKSLPLVRNLPLFKGATMLERKLKWSFDKHDYEIDCSVPAEQIDWTRVLPPSLYGMVSSGIAELKNTNLLENLRSLAGDLDELDQVNMLLKFCQSESIFGYSKGLSIKSVSQQLMDKENDCDGRSVFLYCLLFTALAYPDSDIVFLSWSNHVAIGLRPRTSAALAYLAKNFTAVHDYFVLDPTYLGETMWGSKMKKLPDKCEIIAVPAPLE